MKHIARLTIYGIILTTLFLAGCTPVLQNMETGLAPVTIRLNGPGEAGEETGGARTLMPAGTVAAGLFYRLRLSQGDTVLNETIDAGVTKTIPLAPGAWDLVVYGYENAGDREIGPTKAVLSGAKTFTVLAGTPAGVRVNLTAVVGGTENGTFRYEIRFPHTVSYGRLTLTPLSGGSSGMRDLLSTADGNTITPNSSDNTAAGSFTLAAGYYRLGLEFYDTCRIARKSEILHIYSGMESLAGGPTYTFTETNFTGDPVPVPYATSLPVTLENILAGPSGAYIVDLAADETCPPMTLSPAAAKQFVISIRGNGHTVNPASSEYLFTIGASFGAGPITLVLENITLQGRANNTASLVQVSRSGTLVLETGAVISGNSVTTTASASGGGVSINSGSFIMNGGEISGNSVTGSGQYVSAHGGGVYAGDPFTMNGGKISGNSATSNGISASGGGVHLFGGSFTMNGGEISGNTAYNGGGVYTRDPFTMNGGEISGNTADNGGGVRLFVAPLTMNGGKISGNTGGGVYAQGTFTMSGGEISGNTGTYGSGVYVVSNDPFIMSGAAGGIPDGGNHVYLSSTNVSLIMGGEFTGDPGPIATIDLGGFDGTVTNWLGKNVLKTSPEGGTIDQSIIDRFPLGSFMPRNGASGSLTDYKIDTDGTLAAK
jgi:hypothetical protein